MAQELFYRADSGLANGDIIVSVGGRQDLRPTGGNGAATGTGAQAQGGRDQKDPNRQWADETEEEVVRCYHAFEENIYGFIAMPDPPVGVIALVFLLVLQMVIVIGLTALIFNWVMSDVWDQQSALRSGSDPMCRFDGETWDCTPRELTQLLDFDALDSDKDGEWSSMEAREHSLLESFRAIHEVTLEQPDVLATAFPPQPPVPDYYCGFTTSTVYLRLLSASDIFEMLEVSGRMTGAMLSECRADGLHGACGPGAPNVSADPRCAEPTDWNTRNCLLSKICAISAARSSVSSSEEYYAATSYLSLMPRAVHSAIKQNLLLPCQFLDADLCANKHSRLDAVPMWVSLRPEDKVKQCEALLRQTCPRLLGAHYEAFQVRMGTMCGERSYEVQEVDRARAAAEPEAAGDASCADDDGKAWDLAQRIVAEFPVLKYVVYGSEMASGFPKGTTLAGFTCQIGQQALQLCTETLTMADPEGPTKSRVPLSGLFARVCPATCSAVRPLPWSLPPRCARLQLGLSGAPEGGGTPQQGDAAAASPSAHIQSDLGELIAFGRCSLITFELDEALGSIAITHNSAHTTDPDDACTMLLRPKAAVRAYVVKMELRRREGQRAFAEDTDCFKDRLEIDGRRLCNAARPQYMDIPKADRDVPLLWISCTGCPPYEPLRTTDEATEWQLRLVDAAEVPTSHLKTVSFALNDWYWSPDGRGVMTAPFGIFLVAIMMVWVSFLQQEGSAVKSYLHLLLCCPAIAANRTKQVALVLGVALPRIVIWLGVMYIGAILLAVSTSLVDIVLNSVALSFILDCDEYLFHAVLPWSAKAYFAKNREIQWTEPVMTPKGLRRFGQWHHLHLVLQFGLILAVTAFFTLLVYMLEPGFTTTAYAARCLCALSGEHCAMAD